jgi:hypothetical protein
MFLQTILQLLWKMMLLLSLHFCCRTAFKLESVRQ